MKRILFALLIFTLILATGCQKGTKQPEIVPFQMAPSTDGVDLFLELADDFDHADAGSSYAIAPSEISSQYERQVLLFTFSDIGHDLVLAPDKGGILTVYRAAECDVRSFVEIALSAGEKAASIHWEGERITLKSDWKQ